MLLLEFLLFAAIIFILLLEIAFAVFFVAFKSIIQLIVKALKEGPPYPEKEKKNET